MGTYSINTDINNQVFFFGRPLGFFIVDGAGVPAADVPAADKLLSRRPFCFFIWGVGCGSKSKSSSLLPYMSFKDLFNSVWIVSLTDVPFVICNLSKPCNSSFDNRCFDALKVKSPVDIRKRLSNYTTIQSLF